MKKITLLSVICLASGALFAQNNAASAVTNNNTKSTKEQVNKIPEELKELKSKKEEAPTSGFTVTKEAVKKAGPTIKGSEAISIAPLPPEGVLPEQTKPVATKKEN